MSGDCRKMKWYSTYTCHQLHPSYNMDKTCLYQRLVRIIQCAYTDTLKDVLIWSEDERE